MKKSKLVVLTAGLLFATSSYASYKMAVIENTEGSKAIAAGNYELGITQIEQAETALELGKQINLCVAYAKNMQLHMANKSCDLAVELAVSERDKKVMAKQVQAIALNNRAVYRVQLNDQQGAISDLKHAANIKNLSVVKDNLQKLMTQSKNDHQLVFAPEQHEE